MDMQDKELDQLFRSKLEDLELEPSGKVWSQIIIHHQPKTTIVKRLVPLLTVAASLLLMVSAGLFLFNGNDDVGLVVKIRVPGDTKKTAEYLQAVQQKRVQSSPSTIKQMQFAGNIVYTAVKVKRKGDKNPLFNIQNDKQNNKALAATVPQTKPDLVKGEIERIILATMPQERFTDDIEEKQNQPLKLKTALTVLENSVPGLPIKKRKIHGLGDLLNMVIAKVDKRQDKIIEFTDNGDEGALNVTGVNLGLVAVKKEK